MIGITAISTSYDTSNIQPTQRKNPGRAARNAAKDAPRNRDFVFDNLTATSQNPDAKKPAPPSLKDPHLSAVNLQACSVLSENSHAVFDLISFTEDDTIALTPTKNNIVHNIISSSSIGTFDCSQKGFEFDSAITEGLINNVSLEEFDAMSQMSDLSEVHDTEELQPLNHQTTQEQTHLAVTLQQWDSLATQQKVIQLQQEIEQLGEQRRVLRHQLNPLHQPALHPQILGNYIQITWRIAENMKALRNMIPQTVPQQMH